MAELSDKITAYLADLKQQKELSLGPMPKVNKIKIDTVRYKSDIDDIVRDLIDGR